MHIPVLADACLEWLQVRPDGIYVDCTAGGGGHASLIAERLTTGRLIALDRDAKAVEIARERLARFSNVEVIHRNYAELDAVLREREIDTVDGVLIDAGMSSMQLDDEIRGFSFQQEGPLDMRMDTSRGETAAQWLRRMTPERLASVLREYGDVGPVQRVANAICRRADAGTLQTTSDLRDAVVESLCAGFRAGDIVRQVFQAVRIAVNDELDSLRLALPQAINILRPGGRLIVISFHSGEDRVVKQVLQEFGRTQRILNPDGTVRAKRAPILRVLTKTPVRPSGAEVARNPRSQSARLRAAERLSDGMEA